MRVRSPTKPEMIICFCVCMTTLQPPGLTREATNVGKCDRNSASTDAVRLVANELVPVSCSSGDVVVTLVPFRHGFGPRKSPAEPPGLRS